VSHDELGFSVVLLTYSCSFSLVVPKVGFTAPGVRWDYIGVLSGKVALEVGPSVSVVRLFAI
jgi:hypothetical protein